jgi:hypothetical protein
MYHLLAKLIKFAVGDGTMYVDNDTIYHNKMNPSPKDTRTIKH